MKISYALVISLTSGLLSTVQAQSPSTAANPLPLFDAHIHYSHDAWEVVPPADVIKLMRTAGLKRAMVSSSNDDGTQKLYSLAPDLIVPSLRPYRTRAEVSTWIRDPSVVEHLKTRLARYRYAAVGEFHLYGADAELPVPRAMIALARQYQLILHAHSDADAIERIFAQYPQARVVWAHSGFARASEVAVLLRKYPKLWADFAFRSDMAAGSGVDPEWRAVIQEFPDRFMVGTDTFTPERLAYIPDHAQFSRRWIGALAPDIAQQVAWENGERMIQQVWQPCDATQSDARVIERDGVRVAYRLLQPPRISQPITMLVASCSIAPSSGTQAKLELKAFDATMPEHRHGMNYKPTVQSQGPSAAFDARLIEGIVLHMAGRWQFSFEVQVGEKTVRLTDTMLLR